MTSMPGGPATGTDELVGRVAERDAMLAGLERADHGPAAVLVEGPAGIGKTTIWQAARQAADANGMTVLEARPTEAEAAFAFVSLGDLLEPFVAELVGGLPPARRRALEAALLLGEASSGALDERGVGVAVVSMLADLQRRTPVVVAIDDVQWLDPATRRTLAFVSRRLTGLRVAWSLARRSDDPAEPWPFELDRWLPPDALIRLRLGPVSLSVLHHIIRARLGHALPRQVLLRIEEASGGNPFIALELARAASIDPAAGPRASSHGLAAPQPVTEVLAGRFSALGPRHRPPILAAALAARPTQALLTAGWGRASAAAAIDEASATGVLWSQEGRLRFVHPLYAQAIERIATAEERRSVHARLAQLIDEPEERVRHRALATEPPDASVAAELARVAEGVRSRGAPDTAAALLEQAVAMAPAHAGEIGEWLLRASDYRFDAGQMDDAMRLIDRALEHLPSGPARALGLFARSGLEAYAGDATAVDTCRAGIPEASEAPLMRARLHLKAAFLLEDDLFEAWRHARAGRRIMEAIGPDTPEAAVYLACAMVQESILGMHLGRGDDPARMARAEALLDAPVSLQLRLREWGRAQGGLLGRAVELDRFDEAWSRSLDQNTLYRDAGFDIALAVDEGDIAELAAWRGDLDEADRHADLAEQASEMAGDLPWPRLGAVYGRAIAAAHRGDLAAARGAVAEGLQVAGGVLDPFFGPRLLAVEAMIALSDDDPRTADGAATRALGLLAARREFEPASHRVHGDAVEAAVRVGDLSRAAELLEALDRRIAILPRPWIQTVTARGHALLAAARGDLEAAQGHAAEALRVAAELPMPLEVGRTWLVAGEIHRRRKAKRLAVEAIDQAERIFATLGAERWLERARAERRRVGLRPNAPSELTETERQVARLAADGLTTRQIADAAFMAPKSVEGVLTRIYGKLGLHSRAELGRWVSERPDMAEQGSPDR